MALVCKDIEIRKSQYVTKTQFFYTKIHIKISYRNSRFKHIIFSKYATNLKTKISQGNLIVTQVFSIYYFIIFIFILIDIIDIIIYKSVLRHKNSHQWQCSIVVTCFCLYHVTSILHSHSNQYFRSTCSIKSGQSGSKKRNGSAGPGKERRMRLEEMVDEAAKQQVNICSTSAVHLQYICSTSAVHLQ